MTEKKQKRTPRSYSDKFKGQDSKRENREPSVCLKEHIKFKESKPKIPT